ncbi:hypothetical protein EON63_06280 [archaeon]|nr:MAG: hypothetical protein EON63_06280 [archaeon]
MDYNNLQELKDTVYRINNEGSGRRVAGKSPGCQGVRVCEMTYITIHHHTPISYIAILHHHTQSYCIQ